MTLQFSLKSNCKHSSKLKASKREWQQHQCHKIKLTLEPQQNQICHDDVVIWRISGTSANVHSFLTACNKEHPLSCSTLKRSCHFGAWTDSGHNVLPHRAVTPLFSCADFGPVLLDKTGSQLCWHERTGLAFSRLHYHAPAPYTGRPTAKRSMAKSKLANFRTMLKTGSFADL